MKVTDLVKGNQANFVRYQSGSLIYSIDANGFEFSVPVDELGTAPVGASEKASVFLKWIKATLKAIEEGDNETSL